MFKPKILEKQVEGRLRKKVVALGGMCEKFTSPQRRSVPDRLITMHPNLVWFVELKAPGKGPTDNQYRDHQRRRALGVDVRVIDTYDKVDAFVEEIESISKTMTEIV